jgi:hypothetical protein
MRALIALGARLELDLVQLIGIGEVEHGLVGVERHGCWHRRPVFGVPGRLVRLSAKVKITSPLLKPDYRAVAGSPKTSPSTKSILINLRRGLRRPL